MGLAIVAIALPGQASPSAQVSMPLSRLTVPPGDLPEGCRLARYVPATRQVASDGRTAVVTSNPGSTFPFPSNPWVGTELRLLIHLLGAPPVLDAPPPTVSELSRWEAQWARHVLEGYRALYDLPNGGARPAYGRTLSRTHAMRPGSRTCVTCVAKPGMDAPCRLMCSA